MAMFKNYIRYELENYLLLHLQSSFFTALFPPTSHKITAHKSMSQPYCYYTFNFVAICEISPITVGFQYTTQVKIPQRRALMWMSHKFLSQVDTFVLNLSCCMLSVIVMMEQYSYSQQAWALSLICSPTHQHNFKVLSSTHSTNQSML